jgi:hypothetical protein
MYIGELIKQTNLPVAITQRGSLCGREDKQAVSNRHNTPLIFPGQEITNKLPANHVDCNMRFH